MCARAMSCAVLFVLACPSWCWTQQTRPSIAELRRGIEALESQIRQWEQSTERAAQNDRVTQIGVTRNGRNPELVLRLYDVSDLFAIAPAYEAGRLNDLGNAATPLFPTNTTPQLSGGGGMGGGMFNISGSAQHVQPPAAAFMAQSFGRAGSLGGAQSNAAGGRASIEELLSAIQGTIAPDRWDDNGGEASIARVGTSLLVSADRSMHEQIESLLGLIRGRWRTLRTITVRADWVWLTAAQLAALLDEPRASADEQATTAPRIVIDEAALARTVEENRKDRPDPRDYSAVLTCYNGQTVHVESGGQRMFVTALTPISPNAATGKSASPLYEPQTTVVQDGAALQVTPVATKGGQLVVLDVHSRVVQVDDSSPLTPPNSGHAPQIVFPDQVVAALDRPIVHAHRLSTTLRMPVDRTVLVGGMTFSKPSEGLAVNLYLFVRATIAELQDGVSTVEDATPAESQVPTSDLPGGKVSQP